MGQNNVKPQAVVNRGLPTQSVAATGDVPTIETLRSDLHLAQRAAMVQQDLQCMTEADLSLGDSRFKGKLVNVKSGRERVGNSDCCNKYVRWPQEAVFIGPDQEGLNTTIPHTSSMDFQAHCYSS